MMNRVQLESTIASRSGVARSTVARVVQELQDLVLETMRGGDKVSLVGFGAFHTRIQKARRGKNPKTGEPVDIPESVKPAFRPSKTLIQALNLPKPAPSAKAPPPPGGIRELKKALMLHEEMQQKGRRPARKAPRRRRKSGSKAA